MSKKKNEKENYINQMWLKEREQKRLSEESSKRSAEERKRKAEEKKIKMEQEKILREERKKEEERIVIEEEKQKKAEEPELEIHRKKDHIDLDREVDVEDDQPYVKASLENTETGGVMGICKKCCCSIL